MPSKELFKAREDGLQLGFAIGYIDVSAPTCADDVALVAQNPVAFQALINITVHDAHKEWYEFSHDHDHEQQI